MPLPDMIGHVSKDIDATLAFYRLLGLDIPPREAGQDHVEVIAPNGYRLAWDSEEMIKGLFPNWTAGAGNTALAFKCQSPAEVNEVYAAIIAAGYESEMEPWDAFWGQRYAAVKDPDGNQVDLFAPSKTASGEIPP